MYKNEYFKELKYLISLCETCEEMGTCCGRGECWEEQLEDLEEMIKKLRETEKGI